jgi:hypothetical protein
MQCAIKATRPGDFEIRNFGKNYVGMKLKGLLSFYFTKKPARTGQVSSCGLLILELIKTLREKMSHF